MLARAESLFAAPGASQKEAVEASSLGLAAQAARAIAARTENLSGATVLGHGDVVAAAVERLERVSDSDRRLAESLDGSTQFHDAGRSRAAGIRATASDISAQLQPWAELPAAEVAGLNALRTQVAGMQNLLAHQRAAAARAAAEISLLRYGPTRARAAHD
jgi:hypothetical protein